MVEVTDVSPEAGEPARRPGVLRETGASLRAVFANRNLRRIELAFAGSTIGDWAYGTAVAVWAYDVGGAQAVGIWLAIRYTLMAVTAPFSAAIADRMSRKLLMVIADLVRAVLVGAAAACLFLGLPPAPVFVLATMTALLGTPFMVAQRSMLPTLAERPEELTAANGVASTIESLAFFAGPALGAFMLGFTTVQAVFLLNVATFLWSMVLVLGVRVPARGAAGADDATASGKEYEEQHSGTVGFLAETAEGFRTIARDRGLVLVALAACVQTLVAGAAGVFMVVMADDVLGTGPRGVGFLDSVFGVGSIIGGLVAISRTSRGRLGTDLALGLALWSLPLLLVTGWVHPVTCFVAMALLGLGNPLVDVNLDTVVQRITPDAVLGRVFGSLEACYIAAMALGAFVTPFLIEWLGLRWALLVIALPAAAVALLGLPEFRRLDTRLRRPEQLPLLQGIDIFAPLAPATLESLARSLREVRFPAGDTIVREGADSDRFFVIESGSVEVTQGDRVLRQEGAGEYFGEIGLLRDVPRTATITAVTDTVVQVLSREDFLAAVTGHREARLAAETVASRRLAV
ncbi:MAG TPA: MFS transporter [Marmoricola sp.]|nr:MFS transporter [Marmoricola sp.]